MMDDEITLLSDGDGLAVIGAPSAVERFVSAQGLVSRDFGLRRLSSGASAVTGVGHAASTIAASSGQWVKLTEKSAELMASTPLMKGSSAGVSRGVFTSSNGKITGLVEFVNGPGALLTNPAGLAGAAGIMAQLAMQQAMDEITEYLETIDAKVEDVLRAQKDSVLADMIAVGLVIDEAITVRDQVGRVSEVTWSKVQSASMSIARTQSYALRQLDALAEKLERESNVADLAATVEKAEAVVREWLAVLARCVQLQDALAVLELDRVLDAAPHELDEHRVGLKVARENRVDVICRSTAGILARMATRAEATNKKVLLHPFAARAVIHAANDVAVDVGTFHGVLGVDGAHQVLEAKRWTVAAEEARDKVLATGAAGAAVAARAGSHGFDRARMLVNSVATEVANRTRARPDDDAEPTS